MKWNYGPSLEAGFYSIVAETGKIIALRIPDEAVAKQICREHEMAEELKQASIDIEKAAKKSTRKIKRIGFTDTCKCGHFRRSHLYWDEKQIEYFETHCKYKYCRCGKFRPADKE